MALFEVPIIEASSLFPFPSFSFLHFPVNMGDNGSETGCPNGPNIPDKSSSPARDPDCTGAVGFMALEGYNTAYLLSEAIDGR